MSKAHIESALDGVRWVAVASEPPEGSSDLPYVTHEGVLSIAGFDLRCYQLSDGQRVLDADDVRAFFGEGGAS